MTSASPAADPFDHLARLVYELVDAHHDTIRLAAELADDERWEAHLTYLRDLQRVAREALANAMTGDGACASLARARR